MPHILICKNAFLFVTRQSDSPATPTRRAKTISFESQAAQPWWPPAPAQASRRPDGQAAKQSRGQATGGADSGAPTRARRPGRANLGAPTRARQIGRFDPGAPGALRRTDRLTNWARRPWRASLVAPTGRVGQGAPTRRADQPGLTGQRLELGQFHTSSIPVPYQFQTSSKPSSKPA